jgi:DNA-binding transcriptional LysR family regulator
MQITLRQFEIFSAVVEEKQVTKASQKLFITQSAVSHALSELENQLGGPLFDRDSRSLLLNDRGRYLLPLCREILSKTEHVWEVMNEKKGQLAGSLEIVASSTIGNYVLPHLAGVFMAMYPNTYLTINIHNTKVAEQLIVDRKVDLGLVEGEVSHEQILVKPWFEDELVVIVSPNNVLATGNRFHLSRDMRKSKWVMREKGSGTAQTFKKKIGDYVTDLNVVIELGHTEAIKKAVEAETGMACLSNLAVSGEIERGELKALHLEGVNMKRKLHIIQHKNKVNTRLMDEFLDFCDVMSLCSQGRECLTSPRKLKSVLGEFRREREQDF